MQLSAGQWRRSLATCLSVALLGVFLASASPAHAQQSSPPDAPRAPDDQRDIPRRAVDTLEMVTLRNGPNAGEQGQRITEQDVTCLLPPLTLMRGPTVAVEQLRKTAKARNQYQQACAALRRKKSADAEQHLRKAVHDYPKYATAWVTLGQLFAMQQRIDEARNACFQGSAVDPSYVPAYLCLADIAARERAWDRVLKLSGRALELDPSANAVAYEYHAAANLNLRNLDAAEKSGLRAVEIDRDHHEPRVHFVLAQLYEAKGDSANAAVQLRKYVQYADSAHDVAVVEQYLSELERQTATTSASDSPSGNSASSDRSSTREWSPPDIDERVPPVLSDRACPLSQILKETRNRTLDLIENMQRFSANERIEHIDIDKHGKRRSSNPQTVNYVAQFEQNSSGYPRVQEYRSGGSGIRKTAVMDSGTAAFALIFHPSHIGNFDFRCEGLTELRGSLAWQVHFEESTDPNRSFTAIHSGGLTYLPRFKGRAWITTDSYNVLQIETDLLAPIAQIDLQLEHQVISYAPVEFPKRQVRLWLPDSSSLYIAYRGHRYKRVHTFSQYQLFSVESTEAVKEPIADKVLQFSF
jgi:tetratricopeptide (TPR) repeat protein